MTPRHVVALVLLLVPLCVAFSLAPRPEEPPGNKIPGPIAYQLRHAQAYQLLSIHPRYNPDTNQPKIDQWAILGEADVGSAADRARLTAAFRDAVWHCQGVAGCMNPRHAIRLRDGATTHDILICFECGNAFFYENGQKVGACCVGPSQQPVFDAYLEEAGVPLAPQRDNK